MFNERSVKEMAEYECILKGPDGEEVFTKTMTLDGRSVEELMDDMLESWIEVLREDSYSVEFSKVEPKD